MDAPYGMRRGGLAEAINYSPLHLIWSGGEAVILFFVLSGFVLSLAYYQSRTHSYRPFLVRRFCRIYLPYICAVTLAIAMRLSPVGRETPSGLSESFHNVWTQPLTMELIVKHLLLVPWFDSSQSDPVVWSLIHEMRISIIFPFIMWAVLRWRWQASLAASLLVSAVGMIAGHAMNMMNDFSTLTYVVMFVVGALLAKHQRQLVDACRRLRATVQWSALCAALLCYTFAWWLPGVFLARHATRNLIIAAGCAVIIILTLGTDRMARALLIRPFVFLGRISYSLYLVHMLVLIGVIRVFHGLFPIAALLCVSAVTAVGAAALSYKFIELPSIRLAHRLTSGIRTPCREHTVRRSGQDCRLEGPPQ
jgi:peptidoglycan/LPS O-acetylase OafA/YrhL